MSEFVLRLNGDIQIQKDKLRSNSQSNNFIFQGNESIEQLKIAFTTQCLNASLIGLYIRILSNLTSKFIYVHPSALP